jgi:putative transposase
MLQMELGFKPHGGERKGAGRPKTGIVPHTARPKFGRLMPAHITLRVRRGLPSLRSSRNFKVIRSCFEAAKEANGMRLVEFTVLGNHLHLIVEAPTSERLSRGMQGLCIRLARNLNRLLQRAGSLFADHYHLHLLRTPSEVVNAIRYVLTNAARHFGELRADPFSSIDASLVPAQSWLLRAGQRRLLE